MQKSLVPDIFRKIAPRFGARVSMCDESNVVGQIQFANGVKKYFLYGSIDINTAASVELAENKHFTNFFLSEAGFPIPKEYVCSRMDIRKEDLIFQIKAGVDEFNYPLIIKPNAGAQGVGVVKVNTENELREVSEELLKTNGEFLIQEFLHGRDYRVVVLENQVLSVYERTPLHVIGDGVHSIMELCELKQGEFKKQNRNTVLKLDDLRIAMKLKQQGYGLDSILAKNDKIYLLDNANLSTGGDSIIIDNIHQDFREIATSIVKELGLRFGGVDFIIRGSITNAPTKYWVLEVNASPDLENNFATNQEHLIRLEQCYTEIFKVLDREAKTD